MKFGEKLKFLLEIKDIKQKDFATAINISASTLNGYINSDRQPDFELVKKIASVLGVTTDYLLDYNHTPTPEPISVRELALIKNIREFPKEKQKIIFDLVEMLSENPSKN